MNDSKTKRSRCALGLAVVGALLGCGSEGAEYAPVSGVVTLDGKPFPGAAVMFSPTGGAKDGKRGLASYGVADAAGRFELMTQRRDVGAVPGAHLVEVTAPADRPPLPPNQQKVEIPEDGTDAANIAVSSK
jgi:hypothetical protein